MNFESGFDGSEDLEVVSQVSESPEATPEAVAGLKQLARSCEEHLRTLLRNEEERNDAYESKEGHWASHHFSEFNLWCAKVGVHGEGLRSLEVRLKDVPEICNLLRAHLQSLKQDLEDVQKLLAVPKEASLPPEVSYNDKRSPNLPRETGFQDPIPDNTVPIIPRIEGDDVSSNSSQLSFDSLTSLPRSIEEEPSKKYLDASSARELALRRHIQATIERLHGHALRIEGAGAQHRRERIELYRQKPSQSWLYDRYKELASQKAHVQFPLASDTFKERIAESFARRRIRFDYLRDHHKKRAIQSQGIELPSTPETEPDPRFQDNVGTTLQAEDDEPSFKADQPPQPRPQDQKTIYTTTEDTKLDMGRPKSEPKRTESVASITLRPELPPPPYFSGTAFQCPYCRLEFRAAEADKNRWAEHVMQDFEPYFCIFEDCEAPFDVPNHFDGLLNHLHIHLEECYHIDMPDGKHEELDEARFEEYVTQQGGISSETLALLKETSRRKGAFLFQSCPFCGGYPDDVEKLFPERDTLDAQKALRHHIRSHMRDISLFLPPYRDDVFDQRDGDEISHRASHCADHSIPRNPESFLLTCERDDCDCKTSGKRGEDVPGNSSVDKTPILETPLSVPQTDESFWAKKLAYFPQYDRSAATDDDYLEDNKLRPFIERFQSSSQPYPDSPSTENDEGHAFNYPPLKDSEFAPTTFGNQNEGQVIRNEEMTDVDSPRIIDYGFSQFGSVQDNFDLQPPLEWKQDSYFQNSDIGVEEQKYPRKLSIGSSVVEPRRADGEYSSMQEPFSLDLESSGDNSDLDSETLQDKLMDGHIRSLAGRKVLIEKAGCIVDFLSEGINDDDLPFRLRENDMHRQRMEHYPREDSRPLKASEKWTMLQKVRFLEWQWVILAPFFSREKDGKPMIVMLPDEATLPFVRSNEVAGHGGPFSTVSKTFIHPDHHDLKDRDDTPFAIKKFKSARQTQNRHLMSVLGGFCQRNDSCLIFDWADSDLSKYWMTHKSPDFNYDTVLWVVEQCAGLASGLRLVQQHGNGIQEMPELGRSGSEPPRPRMHSRHGGIKPETILWFNDGTKGGTLKIAYFGLTELSTRGNIFNPCYRPPEGGLRDGKIRPSYDIWSMGCLYLELLAWLLGGWSLVRDMDIAREDPDRGDSMRDNPYYDIKNRQTEAFLKPEFIDYAHTHPKCSEGCEES
ncbi:hypothetical protein CDV31_015805 [Fusarium ambrosium]|uniref:Protein kinase domain-containing protein n=1 Tax=Fusarium ambrosium TaxID=131363 RepID=A0A428SJ10_9HYPO|nr:hypothetical protein CDV31_015805 [Fusarium ambrosium]